jgi:putative hydrolases of HD superfamily
MDPLERLKKQITFIVEADKLKDVFRMNYTVKGNRRENDAEHSWHLALMALLLHEHSNMSVDLLKVLKMILVHDIVEIDAGDSYVYCETAKSVQHEKEVKAADRLFNFFQKTRLMNTGHFGMNSKQGKHPKRNLHMP